MQIGNKLKTTRSKFDVKKKKIRAYENANFCPVKLFK